jgi:hypothetical protein
MTLQSWAEHSWLKAEPTSRREIANLLAIVCFRLSKAIQDTIPSPGIRPLHRVK